MIRRIRSALLVAAAACTMFATGIVTASPGIECPDLNTSNCVMVDMTYEDSCCIDWDGQGPQYWTCTRDAYDCIEGPTYRMGVPGSPYDCHSPVGSCN